MLNAISLSKEQHEARAKLSSTLMRCLSAKIIEKDLFYKEAGKFRTMTDESVEEKTKHYEQLLTAKAA